MAEEKKPLEPIRGGLRSSEGDVRRVTDFVSRLCVYRVGARWWVELYSDARHYFLPIVAHKSRTFSLTWLTKAVRAAALVSEQRGDLTVRFKKLRVRSNPPREKEPRYLEVYVGGDSWGLMCKLFDHAIRTLNRERTSFGLWYGGPGWAADHITRTPARIERDDRLLPRKPFSAKGDKP